MHPATAILLGIGIGIATFGWVASAEVTAVVGVSLIGLAGLNEYVEGRQ